MTSQQIFRHPYRDSPATSQQFSRNPHRESPVTSQQFFQHPYRESPVTSQQIFRHPYRESPATPIFCRRFSSGYLQNPFSDSKPFVKTGFRSSQAVHSGNFTAGENSLPAKLTDYSSAGGSMVITMLTLSLSMGYPKGKGV